MKSRSIGDVAAHFGLRTSALRFYEERGLLTPTRDGGRRCYPDDQLRRLAFVQVGRRLGISLQHIREILDGPEHRWRALVEEQIAALDAQAERIRRARDVLAHSLVCPSPHPVRECRRFGAELDRIVDGGAAAIDAVAAAHA